MNTTMKLLSPIKIGGLDLRNRIVMAPMGTDFCHPDGTMSDTMMDYYEARAKGGVGLIITELTSVNQMKYSPNQLGLWNDKFIPGFTELVKRVHSHGCKLMPQIVHAGTENRSSWTGLEPVGPSSVRSQATKEIPRELTIEEIEMAIQEFVEAVRRAIEAGCDGIELHAAHSHFLVGAFMSPLRNKRFDDYGGSIEGRLKLAVDILKKIKKMAGSNFPIILRIAADEIIPGGRTIEETRYVAPILVEAGVAAFEVSRGVYPELSWLVTPPAGTPLAWNASYAAAVKEVVNVPVIMVGRVTNALIAEHILQTGKADLVTMGRALLADPDLPAKAAEGKFDDIVPCVGCLEGCISARARGNPTTCLANPTLGKERDTAVVIAKKPRRVVVAGGGLAGMEAARVAALRGHEIILLEKEPKLGGQFNLAAVPPLKHELCLLLKYLSTQLLKTGVKVQLGQKATPELIDELEPEVVVIATGAVPLVPDIPGTDNARVYTAWDILAGSPPKYARNVIILGGGMVGCETADFLADPGYNMLTGRTSVTIVEMLKDIALDMAPEARHLLLTRLRDKGVEIITSATVREILDDGVRIVKDDREDVIRSKGRVVLAMGARSSNELAGELEGRTYKVLTIGDAKEPRKGVEAMAEGFETGRSI
ncbi:FAD-dependent oxidoreductase [Chloroflexota bacterium]